MRRERLIAALSMVIGVTLHATHANAQRAPRLTVDPLLTASVATGAGGLSRGMGDATWPGVAWQARIGVQLFPFLAFDGSYSGQFNPGYAPRSGPSVGLVNDTLSANVRLIAPLGRIMPYAFVGIGPSWSSVAHWNGAQTTPFRNNVSFAIPVGLGLSTQLSRHWLVNVEASYQPNVGGTFATEPALNTGDLWRGTLGVGYQM